MRVNGIEGHMTRHTASSRARGRLVAITASCLVAFGASARAQSLETIVQFHCDTGCAPNTGLIQGPDSFFYGTTSEGGASGNEGMAFKMDRTGAITFMPRPFGTILASDGFFYGVSEGTVEYPHGMVFRTDINGAVDVVYAFDGVTAKGGAGPILEARDGSLYGLAELPDSNLLRLFRLSEGGEFRLLRPLPSSITGVRTLIQGRDHFLYGTTYSGCATGAGCVFRTHLKGQSQPLVSLESAPGTGSSSGYGDLMKASDGYFYGTTIEGGAYGLGKIFRMTTNGKMTILHAFDGTDGRNPYSAPIQGKDGFFYGTTGFGGSYDAGTIYRMDRSGAVTILHSFGDSESAGRYPIAPVVQGDDGALYGVTVYGGVNDHGTAFRYTPEGPAREQR
jgi:uncharacterized repeat protein (TIGR03803 family)